MTMNSIQNISHELRNLHVLELFNAHLFRSILHITLKLLLVCQAVFTLQFKKCIERHVGVIRHRCIEQLQSNITQMVIKTTNNTEIDERNLVVINQNVAWMRVSVKDAIRQRSEERRVGKEG